MRRALSESNVFRVAIRPLFWFFLFSGLTGTFGFILISRGLDGFSTQGMAVSAIGVVPSSLFFSWLMSLLYPVHVSEEGLRGHSVWGGRMFCAWQDITEARKFRLINLRWLRIYSAKDRKVMWLPLFQSHEREFFEAIAQFAPADSPILTRIS